MSIEEPSAKKLKLSTSGNGTQSAISESLENDEENLYYFPDCNGGKENVKYYWTSYFSDLFIFSYKGIARFEDSEGVHHQKVQWAQVEFQRLQGWEFKTKEGGQDKFSPANCNHIILEFCKNKQSQFYYSIFLFDFLCIAQWVYKSRTSKTFCPINF